MNKLIMFITIMTIISWVYKQEKELIRCTENCLNETKSSGDENILNAIDYLMNLNDKNSKAFKSKGKSKISLMIKNKVRAIKFTSLPNKTLLIDPLEINATKITFYKENYKIRVVKMNNILI